MTGRLQLQYFVISETKLDYSLPYTQFHIGDYKIRNRWDKSGGWLIEFANKGTKKIKDLKILKYVSTRQSALK